MTRKRLGAGVTVELNGESVGCLISVQLPEMERPETDATCLGDTMMDFISSNQYDAGVMTLELAYEPGSDEAETLEELFHETSHEDRIGDWEIAFAQWEDVDPIEFSGFIRKISPERIQAADLVKRSIEVRVVPAPGGSE